MKSIEEGSIEIILRKVSLNRRPQNEVTELLLTFIVGKDSSRTTVLWTIQTKNTAATPIEFFHSYDEALAELHRRIGICALNEMVVSKFDIYGEIKGTYHNSAARKDGFTARKAPVKPTLILEDVDE